jgi:adenylate kinase family enzyme
MRTLVAGAPCSGKTTVARLLRDSHGVNAVDCDAEIVRLNGGTWPSDFDTKNHVVLPRVLHQASTSDDILLFNGYTPLVYVRRLRRAGFRIALLDVSDDELLRRHAQRREEQGWTNVEWFQTNKADIEELRATGWLDSTISGSAPPDEVAATLLRFHSTPLQVTSVVNR